MSYGEKLSQVTPEYAEKYLFEKSLLVRKAKQEDREEWYKEEFIPYIQECIAESIQEIFQGNFDSAFALFEGKNNHETKSEVWGRINDDMREKLSENDEIIQFLGEENIEHLVCHEEANGLNRITRKLVNACLVLERSYEEPEKESKEKVPTINDVLSFNMGYSEIKKILLENGFVFSRMSNSAHFLFKHEETGFIVNVAAGHSGKIEGGTMRVLKRKLKQYPLLQERN